MDEIKISTRTAFREDWCMDVSVAYFELDGESYHTPYMLNDQKANDMAMADLVRRTSRIAQ